MVNIPRKQEIVFDSRKGYAAAIEPTDVVDFSGKVIGHLDPGELVEIPYGETTLPARIGGHDYQEVAFPGADRFDAYVPPWSIVDGTLKEEDVLWRADDFGGEIPIGLISHGQLVRLRGIKADKVPGLMNCKDGAPVLVFNSRLIRVEYEGQQIEVVPVVGDMFKDIGSADAKDFDPEVGFAFAGYVPVQCLMKTPTEVDDVLAQPGMDEILRRLAAKGVE